MRRPARYATLCCCALLLSLGACSDISWPFHRNSAPVTSDAGAGTDKKAECARIRQDIRRNQESMREAPTTSVSTEIVDAAQAKAEKRIDDLNELYDSMDCPDDDSSDIPAGRIPPLQPAPGGAIP
jgi:hypothetical protein